VNGEAQYLGRYRGKVTDNKDPLGLGRIRATVPDVLGEDPSGWAVPSVPYAGKGVGLFLLPPTDTLVWIEFEHGHPDYPIWVGCFWASGELPADPPGPDTKILKTDVVTLTLDDSQGAGGLTIETTAGMQITLTSNEIEITDGKGATVKLSGPQVSINDGALEVT
jgi:uncharacterized protein involved in type VI secretion and phage assembly